MGKNNKARRAAKAKAKGRGRTRTRSPHAGWDGRDTTDAPEPWFTQAETAHNLWVLSAQARRSEDPFEAQSSRRLCELPARVVLAEAEELFRQQVEVLWAGGWQPAELERQGRIGSPAAVSSRLVGLAIAVDHARRPTRQLDPRWLAQVEGLDLPATDGSAGWIARWAHAQGLDRARTVEAVVTAFANLLYLPSIEMLLPPPGLLGVGRGSPTPARSGTRNPVLERIRNLLAKAESTDFEAEATALTAKAQEMMTRHAIDAAMVDADSSNVRAPAAVRVAIDAPYADAKSLLLQNVAETSRCRAVFHTTLSMSTVVGYPDDLAAVELLFTSLLVQAQHWLTEAAKSAAPGTRTRSQPYRSAFLVAFSGRIKERLWRINDRVVTEVEAEQGGQFLPVLRSRASAVDDFMEERFGETHEGPVRGGFDGAGWAGGRIAADNAKLSSGELSSDPALS